MGRRHAADSEQRARVGDLRPLRKREDFTFGARLHDAMAGKNQRPLRRVDQLERFTMVAVAGERIVIGLGQVRLGRVPVELGQSLLGVLGDIHENGTGTTGLRDGKRLANRRRHVGGRRHQVVVLGDRQGDAGDVGFLKRVGPDQLAADLSGDADDRRAVHHRRGDAGDHVGGARSRGRDRHADAAARPRVAVGHMRRALLVANQDVPNRKLQHRVIRGENRPAGIAEHVGHPFTHQAFPENLCPCSHDHPHDPTPAGPSSRSGASRTVFTIRRKPNSLPEPATIRPAPHSRASNRTPRAAERRITESPRTSTAPTTSRRSTTGSTTPHQQSSPNVPSQSTPRGSAS